MSFYEAFVDELSKMGQKTPMPMFQQQQMKKQWKWMNMPPTQVRPGTPPTPKPPKIDMPNR